MTIPEAKTAASRPFIGVEPFDASYGAGFRPDEEDGEAVECRIVEDGGRFRIHRPRDAGPPARLCFVDGVRRTEAHLTHTSAEGETLSSALRERASRFMPGTMQRGLIPRTVTFQALP